MKNPINIPATFVLLATPLAAYADPVPHTGTLDALVGGAVGGAIGGFLGALLACWLCHRRRKDDTDPKKY